MVVDHKVKLCFGQVDHKVKLCHKVQQGMGQILQKRYFLRKEAFSKNVEHKVKHR